MASRFYWQRELHHSGLNKYRVVKATTRHELDQKASAIIAQWEDQWKKVQEREAKAKEREKKQLERAERLQNIEKSVAYADKLTLQAKQDQMAMDSILKDSLHPQGFNFNVLKDFSKYPVSKPQPPQKSPFDAKPLRENKKYNPPIPFLARLSKKKGDEFYFFHQRQYERDLLIWENHVKAVKEYERLIAEWEKNEAEYRNSQEENNKSVDEFAEAFICGVPWAIERYTSLLLEHIEYPFAFEKTVEAEYTSEEKKLIIDFLLPSKDNIPKLKAVTYVKAKAGLKNTYYPDNYVKSKYDQTIYQIVLQSLNYVFSTIAEEYLQTVIFNGRIKTIDKATGHNIEPIILSISVNRTEFEGINLCAVDPKTWFKRAKGISAASLANVAPIAPLARLSKEDNRFVDGYAVIDNVNEGVNLAAMDWQDFENLIREIFQQEFNAAGGEVKITQASRDGGVDAVAYDPDPIRGGKIVIQAKRYTNVVGVSAVRDLYGTVVSEGANKGILVTTSNFGNDAYNFIRGKPLALLNGAELLYLLQKHGYKARVDIHEAKQQNKDGI